MPRVRQPSKPTGLYLACPFSPVRHPRPLALPLMQGEMRVFARCVCTGNIFCPKDWDPKEGLTLQECQRRGYQILTVVRKFEGAAKRKV